MNKKIAFLFPGQGAQYVGMGKDFYDNFPTARHTFEEADEALSFHFSRLIFEGPSSELTLTKHSQLAIYIVSVALWRVVMEQGNIKPTVCAGLSLGEYTALTASGRLPFISGLSLVKARATYMNDACEKYPGTMQVVLGLDPAQIEEILSTLDPKYLVSVANINCPGQVVIAGTLLGMEAAALRLKEKGAKRVLPLDVSGAFHSALMEEARERLEPLIAATPLQDSSIDLVMNVPGDYVQETKEIQQYLTQQVTHPVRWQKGIEAMKKQGIERYIEIGCGKTLAGMNKRIDPTLLTCGIEKITDLEIEGVLCSY